uniref:Uncharacterized protein n=1 Tax=Physcomitrium patens TaxID=3218 RepID=A0A2K1KEZ2_PHYPA|nr:hypothetical protein PHYPA_008719 [Physcomitrium patens]
MVVVPVFSDPEWGCGSSLLWVFKFNDQGPVSLPLTCKAHGDELASLKPEREVGAGPLPIPCLPCLQDKHGEQRVKEDEITARTNMCSHSATEAWTAFLKG